MASAVFDFSTDCDKIYSLNFLVGVGGGEGRDVGEGCGGGGGGGGGSRGQWVSEAGLSMNFQSSEIRNVIL